MLKLGCNNNGVFTLVLQRLHLLCLYSSTSPSLSKVDNASFSSLVNYLVNSLGFSKQQSLSNYTRVAKFVREKNGSDSYTCFFKNADSVIHFFKQHDFQLSHIGKIVSTHPRILSANVDKTLKPKFKIFLQELDFSESELVRTIVANPCLLQYRLSPPINALRAVLGSDESVRMTLKALNVNLSYVTKYLIPNVELLENYGIPIARVQRHLVWHPNMFLQKTESLVFSVNRVEQELGIPPASNMFLFGVSVLYRVSDKHVKRRIEVYKSFGWTQSDVMKLIRSNPLCLGMSDANIKETLDFLMNELGYEPAYLASHCFMLSCSLHKRVLPRYKLLMVLKEKGLIRTDYPLYDVVCMSQSKFVTKIVLPHKEVHEVYTKLNGITSKMLAPGQTCQDTIKV